MQWQTVSGLNSIICLRGGVPSSSRKKSSSSKKSSNSGNKLTVNDTNGVNSNNYTAKEIISNMIVLQGPNLKNNIKDGISGKTFANPDELLNYYGYVGVDE